MTTAAIHVAIDEDCAVDAAVADGEDITIWFCDSADIANIVFQGHADDVVALLSDALLEAVQTAAKIGWGGPSAPPNGVSDSPVLPPQPCSCRCNQ